MITIPIFDHPNHQYKITLDQVEYVLSFTYNTRQAAWYFGIADRLGVALLRGIKAVNQWPLMPTNRSEALPAGQFVVYHLEDTDDVGREAFNDGALLYYLTEAEAAELLPLAPDAVTLVSIV